MVTRGPGLWYALLGTIPTLAAAAAAAAHATDAGDFVCGVRTARAGGSRGPQAGRRHACAVVCVLTNLTNETRDAPRARAGGLETAAALIPWCAALEGLLPGAGPGAAARAAAAARGGVRKPARHRLAAAQRGADVQAQAVTRRNPRHAQRRRCVSGERRRDGRRRARVLRAQADAGAMESFARAPRLSERRGDARASPLSRASRAGRRFDVPPPKRAATRASATRKAAGTKVALASRRRARRAFGASLRARRRGRAHRRRFHRERDGGGGEAFGRREISETLSLKKRRVETVRFRKRRSDRRDARDRDARGRTRRSSGRDPEGDGLITQAYAALLVAFLVEGQPALRADVRSALPEDGFAALAGVLERFRAFHEQIESISEES